MADSRWVGLDLASGPRLVSGSQGLCCRRVGGGLPSSMRQRFTIPAPPAGFSLLKLHTPDACLPGRFRRLWAGWWYPRLDLPPEFDPNQLSLSHLARGMGSPIEPRSNPRILALLHTGLAPPTGCNCFKMHGKPAFGGGRQRGFCCRVQKRQKQHVSGSKSARFRHGTRRFRHFAHRLGFSGAPGGQVCAPSLYWRFMPVARFSARHHHHHTVGGRTLS